MQKVPVSMIASACPVTNVRSPNVSRSFENFHISYCDRSDGYGCDTTAIVLRDRVFFILNGNHAAQLINTAEEEGIQGCIEYFIENIEKANRYSEHSMATGVINDPFDLFSTALEVIGQDNISKVAQAMPTAPSRSCAL